MQLNMPTESKSGADSNTDARPADTSLAAGEPSSPSGAEVSSDCQVSASQRDTSRDVNSQDVDADAGLSTKAVHAGERRNKPEGSITAPVFMASTYSFESTDALMRFVEGEDQREEYGRYGKSQ